MSTEEYQQLIAGRMGHDPGWPIPMPGGAGSFLVKDLFLLGAAVWITGESLRAMRR